MTDVDPRNYRLMYGFFDGAEVYHLWDCGIDVTAQTALDTGVGDLLGSFATRSEASKEMHRRGGEGLERGQSRTYLILTHAPGESWAEGTLGTADPHAVQRT